jgi:dephospho-CoA kinase
VTGASPRPGADAAGSPEVETAGRRFLLVGLTGGIATGKSTVSAIFHELGCVVIDADLLAREVVERGEPAYRTVVAEFGEGVLQRDGTLDRKKLGAIVFADPARRKRLEAITHPAIHERFARRLGELSAQGFAGIVIFDAPVMIESRNYRHMDRLVVVATDEATQRARLVARDGSPPEEIERKIASQMPVAEKARLADYVIDNSGDWAQTEAQTRRVHAALLQDLRAKVPS